MHDIAGHATTMSLSPVAQDPRSLIFAALPTPHLPVEVQVVRDQCVWLEDVELHVRIIGESHWITLRHPNGSVLHEMLACVALPPAACDVHQSFAELRPFKYRRDIYSASVAFMPMDHTLAKLGSGHEHIEVAFPGMLSDVTPFTRIWWKVSAEVISWRTLHVYIDTSGPLAVLTKSQHIRNAAARTIAVPLTPSPSPAPGTGGWG